MQATPPWIIRHAVPSDAAALQVLYGHLIPDEDVAPLAVAEQRIAALSAWEGSCILLRQVEGGGPPVASVTLIIVPNMTRQGAPYAFIENVVTHRSHRGQGHAKALLAEAEMRAWAAGCYRVMIVSGNHNTAAHGLYQAAGFAGTKTGFQKRRLPDRDPGS